MTAAAGKKRGTGSGGFWIGMAGCIHFSGAAIVIGITGNARQQQHIQ